MTHVNYVDVAKGQAKADWKRKHGREVILAPDMLGASELETPAGMLQCFVCKLADRPGYEPVGWWGYILDGKRVDEVMLDEAGIGRPADENSVVEWARLHLKPSPVKQSPPPLLRVMHCQYQDWAKRRGDVMVYGIVKFTRLLAEKCGVQFTRIADGKAAPWSIIVPSRIGPAPQNVVDA